jgi:multidrug efflux pump subunit AcrA (membrane-fusion protein)
MASPESEGNLAMQRRTRIVNIGLAVALVAAGTGAYVAVGNPASAKTNARTAAVSRQTVTSTVSATGNVASAQDLGLNFAGNGVLTSVPVKVGQHVSKGQVLAVIDNSQQKIGLQQAEAQLSSARGQYLTATEGQTPQEQQRDLVAVAGAQVAVSNAAQSVTNAEQLAALDKQQLQANVSAATATVTKDEATLSSDNNKLSADEQKQQQDEAAGNSSAASGDATQVSADRQQVSQDQTKLAQDQAAVTAATDQQAQTALKDQQAITNAEDQLKTARSQLAQQEATAAVDAQPAKPGMVQSASASITQAEAQVQSATIALAQTVLRAPTAGTVASIAAQPGEESSAGGSSASTSSGSTGGSSTGSSSSSSSTTTSSTTGFIVLTDLTGLQVTADFAEADAAKVRVGQSTTSTFNALTSTSGSPVTVDGTVEAIAIDSTVSSNVVEYAVTVSLDNPPATLKVGQTANVNVTIGSADNVLAVPSVAVNSGGATKTATVLGSNGKQSTVAVGIGLVGDTATEITSGLTEGEQVLLPTTTSTTSTTSNSNGVPGARLPGGGGVAGGLGG